ncbi:MAG: PP2C family serine/threonine-protein phosphatase [Ramlibacter sp.]
MNGGFLFGHFSLHAPGKDNEDSLNCTFLPDGSLLAAVADGVGGNNGGDIASSLAVDSLFALASQASPVPLNLAFTLVAKKIKEVGLKDLLTSEMATTLSACHVTESGKCTVVHAGDSRIYHLRGTGIQQLTVDQTEVAALIEAGILSPQQARTYPRRTVLSSALSVKGKLKIFETMVDLLPGDRLLLLTDGVYRLVSKKTIRDLSVGSGTVNDLVRGLHDAVELNNDDDASAIVFEFQSSHVMDSTSN